MKKLKIALDFDGVISSYKTGWHGLDDIPDPPVPGAIGWIAEAIDAGHKIIIFSMRNASEDYLHPAKEEIEYQYLEAVLNGWDTDDLDTTLPYDFESRHKGVEGISNYLSRWGLESKYIDRIEFAYAKPHCDIMIDDRGWRFEGSFPPVSQLHQISKPWYKK